MNFRPHVFWLFGLSGAGKSTLAMALQKELAVASGGSPLMLDGDRLRNGLCRGLGFSDADRAENLRRGAEVARLATESRQIVVAAFITPREEHRRMVEAIIGPELLSFIHLDASLEVCRERDVKGLYARARVGDGPHMTGVAGSFDAPTCCALRLETGVEEPEISAVRLGHFALRQIAPHHGRGELQAAAV